MISVKVKQDAKLIERLKSKAYTAAAVGVTKTAISSMAYAEAVSPHLTGAWKNSFYIQRLNQSDKTLFRVRLVFGAGIPYAHRVEKEYKRFPAPVRKTAQYVHSNGVRPQGGNMGQVSVLLNRYRNPAADSTGGWR